MGILENLLTRRRWDRINQKEYEKALCLCGNPAVTFLTSGPAVFGRCNEHAELSLTWAWKSIPGSDFWEPCELKDGVWV